MALPESVLIANRGEIAVRIIRTLKRLKIRAIAVYSEADEKALHVEMADEAVFIGGAKPRESYLNMEAILSAAQKTHAQAIHPGYGFLSENTEFSSYVRNAGLIWIGPNPKAIHAMGNKEEARRTMAKAGVPIVPGVEIGGEENDLLEHARNLGYPVMIKASMGGGGIGMKRVEKEEDLKKSWEEARNRAQQAFGDGTLYLEKYIPNPHHVEVQIIGDQHGNAIYLGERECSVQRRYQKVIEEAPSPTITPQTRKEMGETSVRGALSIGYDNAGTMEYLVDSTQGFYFLEMNTRIQVEHPVTEAITGLDLVELQIRVAMGEKLPIDQEDINYRGHAIEARIYAENPKNFLPSPGKITQLFFPDLPRLRIDAGYREGDTVTPFYDPLIAKMIAWEETRDKAIQLLCRGLKESVVEGIKTNIPFLLEVLGDSDFLEGIYTTHLVHKLRP